MEAKTIDPLEVAYYERLAEQWWDKQGKFWPLHRLNQLRVDYLKKAICRHFGRLPDNPYPLTGINVIDVGCGGGILSESMSALGANVYGIDVVEKNIHVARQHSRISGLPIKYECITAEALADRGNTFDVLLNMEVVEHVADLPLFMSDCSKLVSESGITFVATINRSLLSWLIAIVGAEYILGWLPRGTHKWRKFVQPGELTKLLQSNGFKVAESIGVKINPFTRKFTLNRRLTVNYMLAARRTI